MGLSLSNKDRPIRSSKASAVSLALEGVNRRLSDPSREDQHSWLLRGCQAKQNRLPTMQSSRNRSFPFAEPLAPWFCHRSPILLTMTCILFDSALSLSFHWHYLINVQDRTSYTNFSFLFLPLASNHTNLYQVWLPRLVDYAPHIIHGHFSDLPSVLQPNCSGVFSRKHLPRLAISYSSPHIYTWYGVRKSLLKYVAHVQDHRKYHIYCWKVLRYINDGFGPRSTWSVHIQMRLAAGDGVMPRLEYLWKSCGEEVPLVLENSHFLSWIGPRGSRRHAVTWFLRKCSTPLRLRYRFLLLLPRKFLRIEPSIKGRASEPQETSRSPGGYPQIFWCGKQK